MPVVFDLSETCHGKNMDGLDLQLGVHQGYYTQLRTVGTKRNDLDYQLHMWLACGFD